MKAVSYVPNLLIGICSRFISVVTPAELQQGIIAPAENKGYLHPRNYKGLFQAPLSSHATKTSPVLKSHKVQMCPTSLKGWWSSMAILLASVSTAIVTK